jgi:flagellar biosynthesis GTPase FlhF
MMDMVGNSARFNTTGSDKLARMTLGYELKGLLLNYALASRQKAELSIAKDKKALVEKNLASLEKDVKAAKEKCEGDLKTLRDKNAEEVANLTKKYEEDVAAAKRDRESSFKTMNTVQAGMNAKDEHIKALAEENKTALAELATLKQEKANWGAEKDNLEAAIGEQYEEGFQFALEQVKVLFPDLDPDVLGRADAMSTIEGDKLVPHAPAETVPNSPAKESPTEEPSAQGSPAKE